MYKACIFDLDGTLTDTLESLTYSVNTTLKELGLSSITREQCRAYVGNGPRPLLEQALKAVGDHELVHIEQAVEIYARVFKEGCMYQVKPYEGILELLAALKEKGLRLAVLSNKPHEQTTKIVASFFEAGTFDLVEGLKPNVPRKPDPTAAVFIAEKLGFTKEACIYIGDSDTDMMTGNNAGMFPVGVTWGFRDRDVLIEHGAKYLIDHPQELLTIIR